MTSERHLAEGASSEVQLIHSGFSCLVRPALGGSLWSFGWEGRAVLRDRSACATGLVTDAACFPLVPFSNRLRNRKFVLDRRTYELPANVPGADRVAHGFGWRAVWWIVRQTAVSVTIRHEHTQQEGWPWPYAADQHISLGPNGLTIELCVTNHGASPMPAGLGLHPYFPKLGDEQLEILSERVRLPDPDGFPSTDDEWLRAHWSIPGAGAGPHTRYSEGWKTPAVIRRPGAGSIVLTASPNAAHLIIHAPPDEPFFCVEPVTHAVGALNDPTGPGLRRLEPGETECLSMTITPDA